MSKNLQKTENQQLATFTRFQIARQSRVLAGTAMRDACTGIVRKFFTEDKTKKHRHPDGRLMLQLNKRIAAEFAYCGDIDKSEDVFLSSTIESIRLQSEQIFKDYDATWDESEAHYRKMKQALSAIIDIEKEAFERKTKQLEVIKNG